MPVDLKRLPHSCRCEVCQRDGAELLGMLLANLTLAKLQPDAVRLLRLFLSPVPPRETE